MGMGPQLPLVDETFLGFVHELDRVLDGEDMTFEGFVQIVEHGGQRGGFSASRRPGHQDEALLLVAQLPQHRGHSQSPCWTPHASSWVMSIPVSFLVRLAGPSRSNQADNRRGNEFFSFFRGIMRWF